MWARLGRSPLAMSLSYLATLAQRTANKMGGDTPDEMARTYAEGGYIVDEAAMCALAAVRSVADVRAVQTAVRSLYLPWLEAAAEQFQRVVASRPCRRRSARRCIGARRVHPLRGWAAFRSWPAIGFEG